MPLVHRLDVAVAAPQGDTLQHVRPPWGIWSPVLLKSPHRAKMGGLGRGGRWDRGYFFGVGSLNVKTLTVFPRRPRKREARIHLETKKNNPFDVLAIFPVSVQLRSRTVIFVPASRRPPRNHTRSHINTIETSQLAKSVLSSSFRSLLLQHRWSKVSLFCYRHHP